MPDRQKQPSSDDPVINPQHEDHPKPTLCISLNSRALEYLIGDSAELKAVFSEAALRGVIDRKLNGLMPDIETAAEKLLKEHIGKANIMRGFEFSAKGKEAVQRELQSVAITVAKQVIKQELPALSELLASTMQTELRTMVSRIAREQLTQIISKVVDDINHPQPAGGS